MQIRVGVNSGEVVVRAIGRDLQMDYTAVGQTTHLAARMEQMAKPGSALITSATMNLAEGYIHVRPLGAVPLKGLATLTPVYELTGSVATRSRLHANAARGLTRFVGRDRELEQLGQALDRAAVGRGQAVALVGEAGIGKSRLIWEFARWPRPLPDRPQQRLEVLVLFDGAHHEGFGRHAGRNRVSLSFTLAAFAAGSLMRAMYDSAGSAAVRWGTLWAGSTTRCWNFGISLFYRSA